MGHAHDVGDAATASEVVVDLLCILPTGGLLAGQIFDLGNTTVVVQPRDLTGHVHAAAQHPAGDRCEVLSRLGRAVHCTHVEGVCQRVTDEVVGGEGRVVAGVHVPHGARHHVHEVGQRCGFAVGTAHGLTLFLFARRELQNLNRAVVLVEEDRVLGADLLLSGLGIVVPLGKGNDATVLQLACVSRATPDVPRVDQVLDHGGHVLAPVAQGRLRAIHHRLEDRVVSERLTAYEAFLCLNEFITTARTLGVTLEKGVFAVFIETSFPLHGDVVLPAVELLEVIDGLRPIIRFLVEVDRLLTQIPHGNLERVEDVTVLLALVLVLGAGLGQCLRRHTDDGIQVRVLVQDTLVCLLISVEVEQVGRAFRVAVLVNEFFNDALEFLDPCRALSIVFRQLLDVRQKLVIDVSAMPIG